jgi:hypothetical protein
MNRKFQIGKSYLRFEIINIQLRVVLAILYLPLYVILNTLYILS